MLQHSPTLTRLWTLEQHQHIDPKHQNLHSFCRESFFADLSPLTVVGPDLRPAT